MESLLRVDSVRYQHSSGSQCDINRSYIKEESLKIYEVEKLLMHCFAQNNVEQIASEQKGDSSQMYLQNASSPQNNNYSVKWTCEGCDIGFR